MANLLPPAKINLVKFLPSSSALVPKSIEKSSEIISGNNLIVIHTRTIEVKKLLQTSLLLKKEENQKKRIEAEKNKDESREKELEAKPEEAEVGKYEFPSLPKLGFLDRIKRFFINILLGYVAVKLVPYVDKLPGIVGAIGTGIDFATDMFIGLVDGLSTFVQKGYEAYDFARNQIKSFGGDSTLKLFDGFSDALGNIITGAIAASFALADMGGDSGFGSDPKKGYDVSGRRATTKAQERYLQRYGEKQFAKRFGEKTLQTVAKKGAEKTVEKGLLKTIVKRIPIIGGLIDFALNYFVFKQPLGESAFRAAGSTLLSFIGGAIGSILPGPGTIIGAALGGLAGDAVASILYDRIFKNKKISPQKVSKQAEGGLAPPTRGGKLVGGAARRTPPKKPKRSLKVQPTKLKPGASVGGVKKIDPVFPEASPQEQGKTVNPLGYMKTSYDKFSATPGFGGLFAIVLKAQLGEKPTDLDYQNAAEGLTGWMQRTFSTEIMRTGAAYAEGGIVDVGMFGDPGDMKDMIAKSIQNSVTPKVEDTINELMKQLTLKEVDRGKKPGEGPGAEEEPAGSPTLTGNTNAEKVFRYLVDQEGFTPEAAAGVIGNLMQESGVNPQSRQLGGGPGRGIMQWSEGERWASLTAWAKNSGKDPWTLETQVQWMVKEMKDYGTYNRIKSVTSYKKAVEIFEREMERAGIPNYPRRYQYAADALASFGGTAGGKGIPLGKVSGNLQSAKQIASSMGLQVTSYIRPGDSGYHGKGRAMDFQTIGAPGNRGTPSQLAFAQALISKYGTSLKQLIYTPLGFGISNGKQVPLSFWGNETNAEHYHHVHVAFAKGGRVKKPMKAIIGERGEEFIFDHDTTKGLDILAPGLLEQLNYAKTKPQLASILQSYAGYEDGSEEVVQVVVPEPQVVPMMMPIPMDNGMVGGVSSGSNDGSYDFLYQGH